MTTQREAKRITLTIANGAAVSDPVNFSQYAGGIVAMPAAWTAANVGFQIADDEDGPYYPLLNAGNDAPIEIGSPTAGSAYSLPKEIYGAIWFKLWSQDGSGNNTNQGAERALSLLLKS